MAGAHAELAIRDAVGLLRGGYEPRRSVRRPRRRLSGGQRQLRDDAGFTGGAAAHDSAAARDADTAIAHDGVRLMTCVY